MNEQKSHASRAEYVVQEGRGKLIIANGFRRGMAMEVGRRSNWWDQIASIRMAWKGILKYLGTEDRWSELRLSESVASDSWVFLIRLLILGRYHGALRPHFDILSSRCVGAEEGAKLICRGTTYRSGSWIADRDTGSSGISLWRRSNLYSHLLGSGNPCF